MSHFRYTANFIQNVRENYNQALEIFKRLKLPLGGRTDTNFTAPPRMLFQSSKSPFDIQLLEMVASQNKNLLLALIVNTEQFQNT